jgi:hypothetical protein
MTKKPKAFLSAKQNLQRELFLELQRPKARARSQQQQGDRQNSTSPSPVDLNQTGQLQRRNLWLKSATMRYLTTMMLLNQLLQYPHVVEDGNMTTS